MFGWPTLDAKTRDLARYIYIQFTENNATCDTFQLAKAMYLADVACYRYTGKKISNIQWRWWPNGPFDPSVYDYRKDCSYSGFLDSQEVADSKHGHKCVAYVKIDLLSDIEAAFVKKVVNKIYNIDFNELTKVAYSTEPMKKIGAKPNGNANKQLLDFSTITQKTLGPSNS